MRDLDPEQVVIIYNRVPKTGSTSLIGLAYDLCATNGFNVIHINTSRNTPTLSLSDQVGFSSHLNSPSVLVPNFVLFQWIKITFLYQMKIVNEIRFKIHYFFPDEICIQCFKLGWKETGYISWSCSLYWLSKVRYSFRYIEHRLKLIELQLQDNSYIRFGVSRHPIYINMVRAPLDRLVSYYYFLRYGDDLRPNLIRKRQGNKMVVYFLWINKSTIMICIGFCPLI